MPDTRARNRQIARLRTDGWSEYELASEFGVTRTRIQQIVAAESRRLAREAAEEHRLEARRDLLADEIDRLTTEIRRLRLARRALVNQVRIIDDEIVDRSVDRILGFAG